MKNKPLYIIWSENNSVEISILEEQHRGFVAIVNSLHYFIQQGHGLDALKPTLEIMKQFLAFHLTTEKMILAECDYPNIDLADKFQQQSLEYFKKVAKDATINREPELLLKFLKDWWLNHINDQHKEYDNYLKATTK